MNQKLEILGMAEIADLTGIKLDTLYVMAYRGRLPAPDGTINNGRTKWWRRETVEAWTKRR